MKRLLLIWLGKIVSLVSRVLRLGAGSTWPGHIALESEPQILQVLLNQLTEGVILVAGTNGKTTTAKMISEILEAEGDKVVRNRSGANLLNGMVSALIDKSDWFGRIKSNWAIFETDEATLPLVLARFTPRIILLMNLFRDQLDRYGEVDLVAEKWREAFSGLTDKTTVILNADDPHVAHLGLNLKTPVIYFGLEDISCFKKKKEHAVDSVFCPSCGYRLDFEGFYLSHLGKWRCLNCDYRRPYPDISVWDYPLPGVYNRYNTLAAVLVGKTAGINEEVIRKVLADFRPAFGRQEELRVDDKKVKIFLSKNPAGFNENIRTLEEFPEKKKTILLVLNDRIPDGCDVSWIWDVDFEMIPKEYSIIVSGLRVFDLALRLKYAIRSMSCLIVEDLKEAISKGLEQVPRGESLYILPTYSAMLEVRKIIKGKKIL